LIENFIVEYVHQISQTAKVDTNSPANIKVWFTFSMPWWNSKVHNRNYCSYWREKNQKLFTVSFWGIQQVSM